jgi:hypothetical protein
MFEKLHKRHPNKKTALDIVDYLLLNGLDKYHFPEQMDFITLPTTAELWKDLENHEEFYEGIQGKIDEDMNEQTFIKDWSNMEDCGNPIFDEHTPYSAFNIVCRSEKGIRNCLKERLPEILINNDVVIDKNSDGSPQLSLIISMRGTVTRPHVDGCGSDQILLQAYGCKIVFWFERCEELKEEFSRLHCTSRGNYTWIAITEWPGMRWSILTPGEFLNIKAGQIHCVLSPSNSAVCGWKFMETTLEEIDVFKKMMTWEMDIVEHRLKKRSVDLEGCHQMIAVMKDEIRLWKISLEKELTKEVKLKLTQLVKEVSSRVMKLKKQIEAMQRKKNLC